MVDYWKCEQCNHSNRSVLCSHCDYGWFCKNCLRVNNATFSVNDGVCWNCNTESRTRKNKLKNSSWDCRCGCVNYSGVLCSGCDEGWRCDECYDVNRYDFTCFGCKTEFIARKSKLKNSSWVCRGCSTTNYSMLCSSCERGWKCKKCYKVNYSYGGEDTCSSCDTKCPEISRSFRNKEKLKKQEVQKEKELRVALSIKEFKDSGQVKEIDFLSYVNLF